MQLPMYDRSKTVNQITWHDIQEIMSDKSDNAFFACLYRQLRSYNILMIQ